jgi:hypothetical protein
MRASWIFFLKAQTRCQYDCKSVSNIDGVLKGGFSLLQIWGQADLVLILAVSKVEVFCTVEAE